MKNKELKKQLLTETKLYQTYTELRKKAFINGLIVYNYKSINGQLMPAGIADFDYFKPLTKEQVIECENIRCARKKQRQKIENHIDYLFRKNYKLYFVTFNFNDDALKLKANTRKQKVRRLLSQCDDYILNIDYGKENEREHYHAIIAFKENNHETYKNDYKKIKIKQFDSYNLGFYDVQEIRREGKSKEKLARYITKLTSHSIKVSQQYVSVKKGSDYQKYKDIVKNLTNTAKSDLGFWKDYTDELYANEL